MLGLCCRSYHMQSPGFLSSPGDEKDKCFSRTLSSTKALNTNLAVNLSWCWVLLDSGATLCTTWCCSVSGLHHNECGDQRWWQFCVEWATWNGLKVRIDAVYEVWLQYLLVSVYLWGICRSQGRGEESEERWGELGFLWLLGVRTDCPWVTMKECQLKQPWRHSRAIVSLALVSPLTWVSGYSVPIWGETVTFLAGLAVWGSIFRGCLITMPLINCIIFSTVPGPQGTHLFLSAYCKGFVCVYACVCAHVLYHLHCSPISACSFWQLPHQLLLHLSWGRSPTLGLIQLMILSQMRLTPCPTYQHFLSWKSPIHLC